jgi:hypothetical protein
MQTVRLLTVAVALIGVACGGDEGAQGVGSNLSSEDVAGRGGPPDLAIDDGGVLDCVRGDVSDVDAVFACDEITVYTCKDLSNLVIELEDGQIIRFEGQTGQVNTFQAPGGQRIIRVWIKAGNNGSGDGPGYGERVDAPEGSCDNPPGAGSGGEGEAGSSGEGGGAGSAGNGGDPCEDLDPDTNCDEGEVPPGGEAGEGGGEAGEGGGEAGEGGGEAGEEGGGEAGENGGTPQQCVENPNAPGCMVD